MSITICRFEKGKKEWKEKGKWVKRNLNLNCKVDKFGLNVTQVSITLG